MDAQEATQKFKAAQNLYAQGQYIEALQILDELDARYPNTQNILYPKALCLARLDRTAEAAALCDRLINEFQDGRAQSLRAQFGPIPDAGMEGLQLDADLLGDLIQPKPKRPERPPEPPNRIPLYAGIGGAVILAAVLGALLYTGAFGRLLASLKPETAESAMTKIAAASLKVTACSGKFQVNADIAQPMPVKISCTGDFDYLYKDTKSMYRINAAVSMEGLGDMTQAMTVVSDGTTVYNEMDLMGQRMVMKMDADAMAGNVITPAQLLDKVKELGTVTLEKDQIADNMSAYVFSVKPTPGVAPMPAGMPEISDITIAVAKDTGIPASLVVKDKAGAAFLDASVSGVVVNIGSPPDRFKYEPPPGVEVMDMADMQKMMPFPGMPVPK